MEQPDHHVELFRCRLAFGRVVPKHDPAKGRVPDEESGVDGDRSVEAAEPVAVGGPVPLQPGGQRLDRDPLDPGHHPHQVVGVLGAGRREGEATVAAEHRGDPVVRRRARRRVPRKLRVVVRVQVDEPRSQDETVGVDRALRRLAVGVEDDAAVTNTDVGTTAGGTGAVDDVGTADQDVEHECPSGRGWRNSRAAFPCVTACSSSSGRCPMARPRTSWVSGQLESAWG